MKEMEGLSVPGEPDKSQGNRLADLFRQRIVRQQQSGRSATLPQTHGDIIHIRQCGIGGVERAGEFAAN